MKTLALIRLDLAYRHDFVNRRDLKNRHVFQNRADFLNRGWPNPLFLWKHETANICQQKSLKGALRVPECPQGTYWPGL